VGTGGGDQAGPRSPGCSYGESGSGLQRIMTGWRGVLAKRHLPRPQIRMAQEPVHEPGRSAHQSTARRLLPLTRSSGSQPGVVVLGVAVIAAAVSYEHAHGLIRAHGKYG